MILPALNRFRHWLSRPGRHRRRSKRARAPGRLSGLELLEGRVLLDAVRWINPAGGAWEVASNWDAGRTPGPGDDAIIDLQGVAVNHTSGTDSVHSLQLTGSTLTLSDGTIAVATKVQGDGTLTLSGGTLAGATVAAGLTFQDGSRGTLDHVTVNTDLVFIGRTTVGVNVVNGLVLNGTIFLGGNAGTTTGSIVFQNTETVHGHGRIDLGTGHSSEIFITNEATVTLGRHLTITGRAAGINDISFGGRLINKGTINPGQGFSIDNCINEGTIVAQAGTVYITNCTNTGTIVVQGGNVGLGSFTNTGTVMATGGTLTLAGWTNYGVVSASNNAYVTIGNGTNAGGTVSASDQVMMHVNGAVTNTDSTLTLLGSSVLTLGAYSATLVGGTVAGPGTVQFYGGSLDAVTLDADMTLYGNGGVYIQDGLTLNGTLHLRSVVDFLGTQQIDGSGSIVFEGDPFSSGVADLDGNNSVLTLGPSLTVRGQVGAFDAVGNSARFVNEGTIVADGPGRGLDLPSFTNTGTIATGSGQIALSGTWSNSGLLRADPGGTLTLVDGMANALGGTLTAAAGSTVLFGGRLINTGQILTLSGAGTFRLTGTLVGGTVTGAPLQAVNGATLDGVTLDSDLDLATIGGTVAITDGLTLNGTASLGSSTSAIQGAFSFATTEMVGGRGTIALNRGGLYLYATDGTVTLGPELTINGIDASVTARGAGSGFVNEGTIAAVTTPWYSLSVDHCTNHGTVAVSNGSYLFFNSVNAGGTVMVGDGGTLRGNYSQTSGVTVLDNGEIDPSSTLDIQGGTLMGSGLIVGNVRNAGLLVVGGPGTPGRLTIRGNYTQTSASTLRLEVGGTHPGVDFDQLVITGQATLDGTLAVALINGFVPASGDTFPIITAGSVQGVFATLDLDPAFQDPQYDATGVKLIAS